MCKRIFSVIMCLGVISALVLSGCSSDTKSNSDYSQVFERIISGDQIAEYIPFGADGLVAEYEYVEHIYHYGDARAWQTLFRTAFIYDSVEAASKRFTSLKRTYKDDAVQVGNVLYVNQYFVYDNKYSSNDGQKSYDDLFDYMADYEYVLIRAERD
ncbi:MAG: hypothetical protein IKR78_02515 [Dehalococcoidales bacterium]|nr:hypothetical protein [Dehalococcoidales bacterium]